MIKWSPSTDEALLLSTPHERVLRHYCIEPDVDTAQIVMCASYDEKVIASAAAYYDSQKIGYKRVDSQFFKAGPAVPCLVRKRLIHGYIGIDLDGTLAHYEGWNDGVIGKPIPLMVARMWHWLSEGREVRIVTARGGDAAELDRVYKWLWESFHLMIPVQNTKTFRMHELWDDRAIQVVANTGLTLRETIQDDGR